jgi:hypothetical protein
MRIQKNKIVYNVGKSRSISFYDQRDKNFIENKFNIKDLIFSLRGSIGIHGCEYYISLFHKGISINSNGKLFDLEDIDKYKFQKRVLGYTYEVGDFPICETAEDAIKLLNELLKSILK